MVIRMTYKYRLRRFYKVATLPMFLMLAYSGTVYYLYEYEGIKALDISLGISTILGISISLLLGFRTSAAYDRWWEGRKIWGAIINDTRTLVRQLIGFVDGHDRNENIVSITNYAIAWSYALKNTLRRTDLAEEVKPFISEEEWRELENNRNVPNAILKEIELQIRELKETGAVGTYEFVSLDQTIKALTDHMGKCERIKNTIFPIQYRLFTQAGVIIFCLMLPYGMLLSTGPFVMLVSTIVTLFFLFLEMIAHDLQDPFSNKSTDIPMSAICRTIEIELKQMIGNSHTPPVIVPDNEGVLM